MAGLVFMGSPGFALPSLDALVAAGHDLRLVVSRPDQPAGRGRKLRPTEVSARALELGLPLCRPVRMRDPGFLAELRGTEAELFVVVAFRLLPGRILKMPSLGAFNLHGSLLPAYRGAAPIQHALMDGKASTGLTTFLLDRGVDTGGILLQETTPISTGDDLGSLHDRMAVQGAALVVRTVEGLLAGTLTATSQPEGNWPLAPRIEADTRRIDWHRAANMLHNQVRALSPVPAALCRLHDRWLKLFATRVEELPTDDSAPAPGTVLETGGEGPLVACGARALRILELAPEGKRRMRAADWLRGYKLEIGEQME